MPRIIVKSGYMKKGEHREQYAKYIATRDGVEINTSTNGHLPSTKKQNALVESLLENYPSSNELFEYEDYIRDPTRKNASELISTIMEYNLETVLKKENYVGYIANRPRIERLGEHGMFSMGDKPIDLNDVATEVKEHDGNVWTHIISLKREDATRLGYDKAENWKHLCRTKSNELAITMQIDPINLKWYASYHDEGHHPHIHMIAYSTNPKEGYLNKKGITNIKKMFAKEIFHQDLMQHYTKQTTTRDELKQYSKEIVSNVLMNINSQSLEYNQTVFQKLLELKHSLANYHGRAMFAYIPKESKQIIHDILRVLEKDDRLKSLYEQWQFYKQEINQTYSDQLLNKLPLFEQKEFKSIKNMILNETLAMSTDVTYQEINDTFDSDEDEQIGDVEDQYEESEIYLALTSHYRMEWSDDYKEAVQLFYGTDNIEQDHETSKELLLKECNRNNILAYELFGKLEDLTKRSNKAEEYYQKAFTGSLEILESDQSEFVQDYLHYKVGRFYFYGKGTPQDYEQAHQYFSESKSKYAMYSLGTIFQRGLGREINNEEAFYYFSQSAMKKHPFADYEVARCYEQGKGIEINLEKSKKHYKRAYQSFTNSIKEKRDDHLLYRLGMMNYYSKGTSKNIDNAKALLEESISFDNVNAKYLLAKIYLENDEYEHIEQAITWLQESKNPNAYYVLGKEYEDGLHVEKNIDKAIHYYEKCSEQKNAYAMYRLAKIYLTENYEDFEKALSLLKNAANQDHEFAQLKLAMMCLEGTRVTKDIDTALLYLYKAESKNNTFAQYILGKLFLFGKDVPQDIEKAKEYLTKSSLQGNQYAQYLLDHMDDYSSQSLALITSRMFHHISRIFQTQLPNHQQSVLSGVESKLAQKIKQKKIAQGHNEKDHNISIR